jgi:NAD(P)-dependent dehydrogenase (short-subunit alcohol dehydrogenase family)
VDKLNDKVILITGAGKGSGRALAEAFAERGARVAANDISPVNVDEVVNGIVQRGGRAKAYIEDVAKKVGVQHVVKQVEDDFGRIDILVNHAAVEPRIPLLEMDEWDWHRVLDVNLTGVFLMTQSAGRVMRARGEGVIVNLITAAKSPAGSDSPAFTASMSGLEGLTRQAALELRPYGIRVYGLESGAGHEVERVLALLSEPKEES